MVERIPSHGLDAQGLQTGATLHWNLTTAPLVEQAVEQRARLGRSLLVASLGYGVEGEKLVHHALRSWPPPFCTSRRLAVLARMRSLLIMRGADMTSRSARPRLNGVPFL